LQDAFRNAVRQVVGAVVDAETLINNDEIIKDQILTSSRGFVSNYVKISEGVRGGLFRVRIEAAVERLTLVAKLKAVNVTVSEFDGSVVFAQVATQSESRKDAAAMVRQALVELPTLLTCVVDGKPNYSARDSELKLNVLVQVDRGAYAEYLKGLEEVLAKVCIAKEDFILKPRFDGVPKGAGSRVFRYKGERDTPAIFGPSLADKSQWCIWVNHFNSASHDTLSWRGYVLDCDWEEIRDAYQVFTVGHPRRVEGAANSRTFLRVMALSGDDSLVTEDQVELVARFWPGDDDPLPYLRCFMDRSLDARSYEVETVNMYVAPYFFDAERKEIVYTTDRLVPFRFKVTPEELKDIKKFKCKVVWKPGK
jgi:hypothetical protein